MENRWSEAEAPQDAGRNDLALRTYTARLLGAEPGLVLHGGGNTSVKAKARNLLGEEVEALYIKASGLDLAAIEPAGHPACDLAALSRLRGLPPVDDALLAALLRASLLDPRAPTPSIEAPVHAFAPARFVDHTHAAAILALTNRPAGEALAREALGEEVIVLPYVLPGLALAQATAEALAAQPRAIGMVWAKHGLVTWGETARESYERTIELVTRAERFLERERGRGSIVSTAKELLGRVGDALSHAEAARHARLAELAPILRGLLSPPTGDADRPFAPRILSVIADATTLDALSRSEARTLLATPPLTTDHLIRVGRLPLWVELGEEEDNAKCRARLAEALARHVADERAVLARHASEVAASLADADLQPRVVLVPGLGAFTTGRTARDAAIARDITVQALEVKAAIGAAGGSYEGLADEHLVAMQYRGMQQAKLGRAEPLTPALSPLTRSEGAGTDSAIQALGEQGQGVGASPTPSLRVSGERAGVRGAPLQGSIALVTGAAGAIGSGICSVLLEAGACVALTDLAGSALDSLAAELAAEFPHQVLAVALDVTDRESVAAAFAAVTRAWGGVDLVVANAGVAHVATLEALDLDAFRRLERVNVEGTLHLLAEAARLFRRQAMGGDVVLISTKNVFAPGASFGAYSATKAAAHQLARVAALELAPIGVRVNMVAPDAVFGEAERKSGLWAEVGPARMQARGLDQAGLEDYYRDRNLLKARVTARHVGNAVLFFATRQTPTTGATLSVDGGLPEATPR